MRRASFPSRPEVRGSLIWVRHGESLGNAVQRFTRTHHAPLTALGQEQARRTGALIQKRFEPVRLISSPYRRAQMTAEIIGEAKTSIMHLANHAFDCIGAKACGMRTAFIDRRKRPYGETPHQPDLIVSNFTELADALL